MVVGLGKPVHASPQILSPKILGNAVAAVEPEGRRPGIWTKSPVHSTSPNAAVAGLGSKKNWVSRINKYLLNVM